MCKRAAALIELDCLGDLLIGELAAPTLDAAPFEVVSGSATVDRERRSKIVEQETLLVGGDQEINIRLAEQAWVCPRP